MPQRLYKPISLQILYTVTKTAKSNTKKSLHNDIKQNKNHSENRLHLRRQAHIKSKNNYWTFQRILTLEQLLVRSIPLNDRRRKIDQYNSSIYKCRAPSLSIKICWTNRPAVENISTSFAVIKMIRVKHNSVHYQYRLTDDTKVIRILRKDRNLSSLEKYCHVSGVPWLIIMGSRLAVWIYWHFYCNYNNISSQSMTVSKTRAIPYWTTSLFSSAVTDLVLIYESVTSSAPVVGW
jgi:hypothetical protein